MANHNHAIDLSILFEFQDFQTPPNSKFTQKIFANSGVLYGSEEIWHSGDY